MVTYKILITKAALKDKEKIKGNKALESKVKNLIELISKNPYETPPSFEKLKGDLDGLISRRINIQHRLVYQVYEEEKVVKIISMWTHYENL
ncbi:Txe/YoeB family addiction module toxin [Peptoniphilus grossensis]|uniref:Txe/YoeB family addiction module toxin n=1 Tax=Peptoniphilus grossensis TaxID=1465756 RepID=UPI003994D96C